MYTKKLLETYLNSIGVTFNGDKPYDIRVRNPKIYNRMFLENSLGAGESYMDGWWDCDQLDESFFRICRTSLYEKLYSKWQITLRSILNTIVNNQTHIKSRQVAEQHYNLGNDFYRTMLGETMAYTCAYWKNATTLDQAQYNKFDLICRKLGLKPGERVLDLGCGWGSLAKYMAEKYGCIVDAVNISTEQIRYAKEHAQGFPVTYHLCDYRDDHIYNPEKKPYDKVVSVGLCEHIGHKNYQTFIQIARKNLKAEGLFLLHTIGKNDSTHYVDPWIDKYIFPNGMLPSIKLLAEAMESSFVVEDLHNFGDDYDKTLMAWHKNFTDNWDQMTLESHLDRDRFFRLWNYYLLSCAGGFRARSMQLWQFVLSPKGVLGGYESVR